MTLKGLVDEDIANYYRTSMFLIFPTCSWKCGIKECQNSALAQAPTISITKEDICERYLANPLSEAIVCGGLEPLDSLMDLVSFVDTLRNRYHCQDDVVIYTGYTEEEVNEGRLKGNVHQDIAKNMLDSLLSYGNIIVKYGRFVPGDKPHYDTVLKVNLASSNQYAKAYNKETNNADNN